jgi:hypothetical protein
LAKLQRIGLFFAVLMGSAVVYFGALQVMGLKLKQLFRR